MLQFSFPNQRLPALPSPLLSFDSRKLGSTRIIKLVEEIGKVGTTKILLLGNNKITDSAIPAIVQHLILNPKVFLEELDLGGNNLTNDGAQQLISALQQRNTLNKLFLKGNPEISAENLKGISTLMAAGKEKNKNTTENP